MGLTPLLVVLIVLFIAVEAGRRLVRKPESRRSAAPTYPYYGKTALFSAAERSSSAFWSKRSRAATGSSARSAWPTLWGQGGYTAAERQRALNRLTPEPRRLRAVPFPRTWRSRRFVELDDAAHQRSDSEARDAFLEQALAVAGVQLLRFPARAGSSLSEVRAGLASLEGAVDVHAPAAPSPPIVGRPGARR